MSGKRAKPKGADPSVLDPSSAESATADRPSVGVTTDLLERPTSGQAAPVLPGSARAGARSAARVERQRRERQRRLIAAASVAALVLGLLGWFVLRGDDAPPATVTAAARTQSTVLLAVGGESITGLALLAADPATGEGAVVLLPNRLMVDVAGFGPMTLAQATELSSADAGADALTDALGVTIDGTWRLDDAGLAALVDAAGGVTVDVDTDITGPGPTRGSTVILIPAGSPDPRRCLGGRLCGLSGRRRAGAEPAGAARRRPVRRGCRAAGRRRPGDPSAGDAWRWVVEHRA